MRQTRLLTFAAFLLLYLTTSCGPRDAWYSAHVWQDLDGNGEQNDGEQPLAGIVIQIIDSEGRLWQRAVTDENGDISAFSAGGACGQYDMYLSVPDGYWPTTAVVASTPKCETARFGLQPYP